MPLLCTYGLHAWRVSSPCAIARTGSGCLCICLSLSPSVGEAGWSAYAFLYRLRRPVLARTETTKDMPPQNPEIERYLPTDFFCSNSNYCKYSIFLWELDNSGGSGTSSNTNILYLLYGHFATSKRTVAGSIPDSSIFRISNFNYCKDSIFLLGAR